MKIQVNPHCKSTYFVRCAVRYFSKLYWLWLLIFVTILSTIAIVTDRVYPKPGFWKCHMEDTKKCHVQIAFLRHIFLADCDLRMIPENPISGIPTSLLILLIYLQTVLYNYCTFEKSLIRKKHMHLDISNWLIQMAWAANQNLPTFNKGKNMI